MKDWEDLEAMLGEIADYACRTGQEVFCDDIVGSHHGFNVGGRVWRYKAVHLLTYLLRIEDIQKRNIIHRALATAAERRSLCKAFPKMGRQGPSSRFERDDVI